MGSGGLTRGLDVTGLGSLLGGRRRSGGPSGTIVVFTVVNMLITMTTTTCNVCEFFAPSCLSSFSSRCSSRFSSSFFRSRSSSSTRRRGRTPGAGRRGWSFLSGKNCVYDPRFSLYIGRNVYDRTCGKVVGCGREWRLRRGEV